MKNTSTSNSISNAIHKGIRYLLSQQINGHWKGFPTLAGQSDVWVTGFVLAHTRHLCGSQADVKDAEEFLLASRHATGGWSYSAPVPPDADSTAWCLMALQSSGKLTAEGAALTKTFLWSHFTGKGISTYTVNSGIKEFIGAPDDATVAGWTGAHPDVSIAAVLADLQHEKTTSIINWICSLQNSHGLIDAYWWRGPYYTTTLLLRAISQLKHKLTPAQAGKMAEALAATQLTGGGFSIDASANQSAFTTALALESFTHLCYLGYDDERDNCGTALLALQEKNGGWPGDFILRIPAPFITDPNQVTTWINAHGGGGSLVADNEGLFATAMACYALDMWRQTIHQKQQEL